MDAYEQFGFTRPPFDPLPDARFFYGAPAHAETLATLECVIFAAKGCCAVVGESGCGKTLLARMIAASAGANTPVLWVNGCGQPDSETTVSVYPAGRFGREGDDSAIEQTTLGTETRLARFLGNPPLLIVNCADALPLHGWRDVIAWLSNETRYPQALTVLLFGLPRVLETLAIPELVRLQRRIFRVCRIEPLSAQLTKEFIGARIAAAGGPDDVFSDEVVAAIAQHAQGNPALINQLCDNALLEAYGEGHDRVVMADVNNALHTMFAERLREQAALPAPLSTPFARLALPPVSAPVSQYTPAALFEMPGLIQAADPDLPRVEAKCSIETRLKLFETRLAQALQAIREAGDRQEGGDQDVPIVVDDRCSPAVDTRLIAPPVDVEAESRTIREVHAEPTT